MSTLHRRQLVSWRFRRSSGAAQHLTARQRIYVDNVNRQLADGRLCLTHSACPCGASAAVVVAEIDRYGIALDTVVCERCGTLRFDPYLTPDAVSQFYRKQYQDMYARADDPEPYFAKQRLYGERLLRWASRAGPMPRVVAEVGCGAGGALDVFRAAGIEVYGYDYSQRLIDHGTSKGVPNLVCGDLAALSNRLSEHGHRADLVFLHHVFEHLDDPLSWLMSAQQVLASGGMIVVAVPDVTRLEGFVSPDGDLRQFLHIAHKFNFTAAGLRALARRAALQARPLDIEPSTQAPEVWIGFTVSARSATTFDPAPSADADARALRRYLREVESRHLRRAVGRRLARYWSSLMRSLGLPDAPRSGRPHSSS